MPANGYYYVLTESDFSAIQALGSAYSDFLDLFSWDADAQIYYASVNAVSQDDILMLLDEDIDIPTWKYTASTQWETGL